MTFNTRRESNISKTEDKKTNKVILAQLRSGYSPNLNSYPNRIKPTNYPTDSCPDCWQSPYTTNHFFDYPENPIILPTLLEDPAASFLGLAANIELVLDDGLQRHMYIV